MLDFVTVFTSFALIWLVSASERITHAAANCFGPVISEPSFIAMAYFGRASGMS
jgi:hypothetical protein